MIKVATEEDFPVLRELMSALVKESIYTKLFEDYQVSDYMLSLYTNPNTYRDKIGVIAYDGETPVGLGVFDIVPWLYSDVPIRIARYAYTYIKPEYRNKGYGKELMKAFEYWGKSVEAKWYSIGFKTKGYSPIETIYMKEIK